MNTLHLSESRTEDLVIDLLRINGWSAKRPPKGNLLRKNEYKGFPELETWFRGKSKTGRGDGYPDFLLVSASTRKPLIVIETKAKVEAFSDAVQEACDYASACVEDGESVLAIGVAGQEDTRFRVGVHKYVDGAWRPITYNHKAIEWIPTPTDALRLQHAPDLIDLAPIVPDHEILAEKAELLNRILREASVKDEYRAAYVGAMMLALWKSRGDLRRSEENILSDINRACQAAFTEAGKPELAKSLQIDEANTKLAQSAWKLLSTLEKLNVVTASFDHDYLGQIYELFFRYTGGNTIGQYFTPRHITRFMADLCEVTASDRVIDPACGTGGFLIACLQRAVESSNQKYEAVIEQVKHNLFGYESEPVTAALCVANMMLRGDGKTHIVKDDCLTAPSYPIGACQVALMNPPFPHKKTDTPPQEFVKRALEALETRGKLAVILPTSLIVKREYGPWREEILQHHTLLAVAQLPDEVFQPFASATTSIVLLEKGVPHSAKKQTVFVRIQYDGLTLKKGTRVKRADGLNQLDLAVDAILNKRVLPGFSGVASVSLHEEWSPGAHIPTSLPDEDDLKASIDESMRRLGSFYVRYAREIANMQQKIEMDELNVRPYLDLLTDARMENAEKLPNHDGTIGQFFQLFYGMKELHSRDGIAPGDALIISPTEEYNGCYGWLSFDPLIEPPFITVAQTGSIGESFVQVEPCAVNDDCLILLPRQDMPLARFFIAASIIHLEKWRFNYGRKLTPARICEFPMQVMPALEAWAEARLRTWTEIWSQSVDMYR